MAGSPTTSTTIRARLGEDVARLPWLVTRTPAVLVPTVLAIAATLWFSTSGGSLRDGPGVAFNFLVFPPPFLGLFVAGLLAPRAGYMVGVVVGLVLAVIFSVYMLVGPVPSSPTLGDREAYVVYGLVVSPVAGLFSGAAGGLVRRVTLWFVRQALGIGEPSPPVGWGLSAKLAELDDAKARGLISDEEYAARRDKILETR